MSGLNSLLFAEDSPTLSSRSSKKYEIVPFQKSDNSSVTAFPFSNSHAISIIEEGEPKEKLVGMVKQYLGSEEKNSRSNFECIVYSLKMFRDLGWTFHDFFISFEEMVMTIRKELLQETDFKESDQLQIGTMIMNRQLVKGREGILMANDPEIHNSYRRARHFIKTFSLRIFDLVKAYNNCKDDGDADNLTKSIASLWPLVSIGKVEMRELISILQECIGQIRGEDLLFINLSGQGFLSLREEFYRLFTSSHELARYVKDGAMVRGINFIENFFRKEMSKEQFRFSEDNSNKVWKFLQDFYSCIAPNSFQQSAPQITDERSSTTPLNLSTIKASLTEINCADSKKRKDREYDSSEPGPYMLRSRSGYSGNSGNTGDSCDKDMLKLKEALDRAKENSRKNAAKKERAETAKERAQTKKKQAEEKAEMVVQKKRKRKDDVDDSDLENDDEKELAEEDNDDDDDQEEEEAVESDRMESDRVEIVKASEFGEEVIVDEIEVTERVQRAGDLTDPFEVSFYEEVRCLEDTYLDVEEDWDDDSYQFQNHSMEHRNLPSLDKPQEVLEWIYEELKNEFTMDELVQSIKFGLFEDSGEELPNGADNLEVKSAVPVADETFPFMDAVETSKATSVAAAEDPVQSPKEESVAAFAAAKTSNYISETAGKVPGQIPLEESNYSQFLSDVPEFDLNPVEENSSSSSSSSSSSKFLSDVPDFDYNPVGEKSSSSSSSSSSLSLSLTLKMQASDYSPGEVASIPILTSDVVETSNDLSVTAAKDPAYERCPVDAVVDVCLFLELLSKREIPVVVINQILQFVHEDLSHLINKELSNIQCRQRPFKLGHDKLTYSLYIRANLFKEKEFDYRNVLISSIKDIRWCADSFDYYSKKYESIFKILTWPSCSIAYKYKSNVLLTLARRNGCSCVYDMREMLPMEPIEVQTIDWIQKNSIEHHKKVPYFRNKPDGIQETMYSIRGECHWNSYMIGGSTYIPQMEDIDEDDYLQANIIKRDITESAAMDICVHAKVKKLVMENQFCFPAAPPFVEEVNNDNTWAYKTEIDSQVTDKEICLYPPLSVAKKLNIRYSIAISIFSHATRLLMLGNRSQFEGLPSKWNTFRDHVNTINEGQYKKHFKETDSVKISVASILESKCINLVPRANFGRNFIAKCTISVSLEDHTTERLADKLLENIVYNKNHGLYVFNITECPIANTMCEVYLPLLIRKDDLIFQTVAAVYKSNVGEDSLRLVTRSMQGLCDNMYMWTTFSWITLSERWTSDTYKTVSFTNGKVLPINIKKSVLSCLVLIPTRVQKIPLGQHYTERLVSGPESMDKKWTVNDYVSVDEDKVLTEKVLNTLVQRAVEQYMFSETDQRFIVSAYLIGDIDNFLKFSRSSWSITPSGYSSGTYEFSSRILGQFIHNIKPENSKKGSLRVFHIFIPYHTDQGPCWVYLYYVYATKTLVVMSTKENAARNIMAIASSFKAIFEIFLKCEVKVFNLIWRRYLVDVRKGNAGLYCLKFFLTNATTIHNNITSHVTQKTVDYLVKYEQLIEKLENASDDGVSCRRKIILPKWFPKEITKKQMDQIKIICRDIVFNPRCKSHIPEFLID